MKLQCYETPEIELRAAVATMKNLFRRRVQSVSYSHFSWGGWGVEDAKCMDIKHDSYFAKGEEDNYFLDHIGV